MIGFKPRTSSPPPPPAARPELPPDPIRAATEQAARELRELRRDYAAAVWRATASPPVPGAPRDAARLAVDLGITPTGHNSDLGLAIRWREWKGWAAAEADALAEVEAIEARIERANVEATALRRKANDIMAMASAGHAAAAAKVRGASAYVDAMARTCIDRRDLAPHWPGLRQVRENRISAGLTDSEIAEADALDAATETPTSKKGRPR